MLFLHPLHGGRVMDNVRPCYFYYFIIYIANYSETFVTSLPMSAKPTILLLYNILQFFFSYQDNSIITQNR